MRPGRGVRGVEGKRSGEWADEYAAALRSIYAMQSASCICIESAPVVWNLLESVRAARDAAERPHEIGADRARRAGAWVIGIFMAGKGKVKAPNDVCVNYRWSRGKL